METVQHVRFPQEWGGLWKREYGCRSHTGRWVMRDPYGSSNRTTHISPRNSTQIIKERRKENGHTRESIRFSYTVIIPHVTSFVMSFSMQFRKKFRKNIQYIMLTDCELCANIYSDKIHPQRQKKNDNSYKKGRTLQCT